MVGIASGLGDEYDDTSAMIGQLPRCKKGDGVLTVNAGAARVVLEMTDSVRTGWTGYLDEAKRNRDAVASLGLVRTGDRNGGQTIRLIGAQRVVMAFDPESDDPDLLRTVVMLLRTVAITTSARKGSHQVATAEEKISRWSCGHQAGSSSAGPPPLPAWETRTRKRHHQSRLTGAGRRGGLRDWPAGP